MKIRIILTGGTIDQSFAPTSPKSFVYDETHIHEMLEQARSRLDVEIDQLMLLNSEDINEEQLAKLVTACQQSSETHIVITHGTNTMTQTAQLLASKVSDKTIVITGSMVPFAIGHSDALFNLGTALTAVQLLESGVYVAMNGKIFTSDSVEKDFDLGEFVVRSS